MGVSVGEPTPPAGQRALSASDAASVERGSAPAAAPAPRRLELVISGEHGLESEPPPAPSGAVPAVIAEAPSGAGEAPVSAVALVAGGAGRPSTREERLGPASTVHTRVATSVLASQIPFGPAEQRMIRSLASWIALTGLAMIGVSAVCGAQWATGRASVPSAVVSVLAGAIGLWSLLAGWHFGRVVASDRDDTHQLVRAFSNLRSIFILQAIGLFLALALGCFAFSIVASLLALL